MRLGLPRGLRGTGSHRCQVCPIEPTSVRLRESVDIGAPHSCECGAPICQMGYVMKRESLALRGDELPHLC